MYLPSCLSYAAAGALALVLVGCGRDADRTVDKTQTTSAVLVRTESSPPASATVSEPPQEGPPVAWSRAEGTLVEGPYHATVPSYEEPPLHESHGSTYSDVGEPYPLPDVPSALFVSPARPTVPDVPPEPFVESSFGPTPPSPGFVESSFGPDAGY